MENVRSRHRGLRFQLLGPIRAWKDHREIDIGPAKQRATLALLLLKHDTHVARERIIEVLWGVDAWPGAVNCVQAYISRLRRLLEPNGGGRGAAQVLVTVNGGYRLKVAAEAVDLHRFRALSASTGDADAEADLWRAHKDMTNALDMWTGDPLSDLHPEIRRRLDVELLCGERTATLTRFACTAFQLGRPENVVPLLEAEVKRAPYDEALCACLMLAYAGTGRQAAALEMYESISRQLADDLGLDPSALLRDAHLAVLQQRVPSRATPLALPHAG